MNETEIRTEIEKALAAGTETELVEFKDARGGFPKDPVSHTLSAFGNTKGGIIVFGVSEKDKKYAVDGVQDSATLQERMTALSAGDMNEVLRLDYHLLTVKEQTILAVYVPECHNRIKPYHIKALGLPRGAYIRDGNTDRQMTEAEMREYIRNGQTDDFDSHCADDLAEADLSDNKIKHFLAESAKKTKRDFPEGIPTTDVLVNIGVLGNCEGVLRPTLAGYLLFANGAPQQKKQFDRYVIRCVRYAGSGADTDILDKADIIGTLDEQIDQMHAFVLRNIRKSASIVGTKRVEKYEYPEKAIREIVANAVIHRDYRITETYTQVNVFDDRIEVFNPGNLPPGVTVENIKTAQVSRNKIIAARLNEMDYLEEYGRGIDIVFAKMAEWDLLPPILKDTANSFRVILPGPKLSALNERQHMIWQRLMMQRRITRRDIEEMLPEASEQTIGLDLRTMRDLGLLRQEGQARNTYYEAAF